jgi:DNA mismatch endonuclease, patch repair protein
LTDSVDKNTRSRYMAAVKSRGNLSTEARMVLLLREYKLSGWRRHFALPGTPDFCWPRQRVALFVDGCFWHGCPRCYQPPKSNVEYWTEKVATNKRRDRLVNSRLRAKGWTVVRIWECRLIKKPYFHMAHLKKVLGIRA